MSRSKGNIAIMNDHSEEPVELEFSSKYDRAHAEQYLSKHKNVSWRQRSHFREESIARKALKMAGNPKTVLDLPCGAGRFWPLLMEHPTRQVIAADNSADMVAVASEHYSQWVGSRIKGMQTSAFNIELEDNSVDSVFCMRLLHHIEQSEHRINIFKEFHRVSKDTAIVSLWVDGNLKAWRRKQIEAKRIKSKGHRSQNRFLITRQQVESEFDQAGFNIVGHVDFLPLFSMWRIYVLQKK